MSITFTPVPRQRNRHDGWSAEKQVAFIEALSDHGIVSAAARTVGMNTASAYRLREADGAEGFAAAWDKALKNGAAQLIDIALDRAINGVAVPKFYRGEQVGEGRWFDNRLMMFMLQHLHPHRFGRFAAEMEMAERADRQQAEAEAKRLAQLERAEALLARTEAELEEWEDREVQRRAEQGDAPDRRMEAIQAQHDLLQRRDRLCEIVAQLRRVDTVREAEANIDAMVAARRYSARVGATFKRRLHASGRGP